MTDSAYLNALKKRRDLQTEIKRNMQELEKIEKWLSTYRELVAPSEKNELLTQELDKSPSTLSLAGKGTAQQLFETYVRAILLDAGRPMRSDEIIEECRKRGHPLGGQETRTAWNRMWMAKKDGVLDHVPKLGYWLTGEPLTEEGRQKAIEARLNSPKRPADPRRHIRTGHKKGRQRSVTDAQLKRAEELVLTTDMSFNEIADHLGIGRSLLHYYFPKELKASLAEKKANQSNNPEIRTPEDSN
jgi:predicted DNA-binding protein YlxM (UPF0122 family)